MTAVPDNDKLVQSVIDNITSKLDGTDPVVEEVVPEKDADGNIIVTEDPDKGDGLVPDETKITEDGTKDNAAFAAMRVANKDQKSEIEKLKAENLALKGEAPVVEPVVDVVVDPLAAKETDSAEVKLLKEEIARQKAVTDDLAKDKNTRITQAQEAQIVGELTVLQTKHKLDEPALLKFAKDAQDAGFTLGETTLTVDQIYNVLYHDTMIAAAIKTVEADTNDSIAPGTGPTGSGGGAGVKRTNRDILNAVGKKVGL